MKKGNLFIVLFLLFSLFIYVFYRTEKTVVNELLIAVISYPHYAALRTAVADVLPLSKPVIYSLPEGLWIFCITLTSSAFYIQAGRKKIACVFMPLLFCIGLELLQLLGITNGRFDFLDIWTSISFWLMAYFFFSHQRGKQNIVSPVNFKTVVCFVSYGIVYLAHVME